MQKEQTKYDILLITVRGFYLVVCAAVTVTYLVAERPQSILLVNPLLSFFLIVGTTQVVTVIDMAVRKKSLPVFSAIYFGLLVGWLLSFLLNQALTPLLAGSEIRELVPLLTPLMLPYLCVALLLQTRDDFRFVIPYVEFVKKVKGGRPFILDTSAIIDGRIADVIETKILDAELIVPSFVLQELQHIADSNDKLRRNRGRRGLDVLNKLRLCDDVDVTMYDAAAPELKDMSNDQRVVAVAQDVGGRVVTNDFNLNKIAAVQGVDVVNLNDVANSLKPRYLPGERMQIKIIKEGESTGQGVGYLDDGTMVVCEQAQQMVGSDADMVVTSVLQNSAGRMIFGKLFERSEH